MISSDRKIAAWSGKMKFEDTALAVADSGGPGIPLLYLNGSYADRSHWRRVISELGGEWRHITYDERARGGSETSSGYSFDASMRDVSAVMDARGVERALLVGWSYGATLPRGMWTSTRIVCWGSWLSMPASRTASPAPQPKSASASCSIGCASSSRSRCGSAGAPG